MGFLDPNSWAMAFDDSQEQATNKQLEQAQTQLDFSKAIYDQSRQDFQPYQALGIPASYMLQSAILGSPVEGLSPYWSKLADGSYKNDITGALSTTAPTQSYSFNLENNPLLTSITQPATKAYNRGMASRGLLGGGQAATGLSDIQLSALPTAWSMLIDPIKIATGASASAGNQAGTALSGMNSANQQSGTALQNYANAKTSLYGNLAGQGYNTASLAMKGYDWGKSNGWWGNSSGTGSGGLGDEYSSTSLWNLGYD